MRFRVKHLLVAAIVVAWFAFVLARPSEVLAGWTRFGLWLAYAAMACRAACSPRERAVLACAVICGFSYLWVWFRESDWPPTALLQTVVGAATGVKESSDSVPTGIFAPDSDPFGNDPAFAQHVATQQRIRVGQDAMSILFALVGAALAGYWTRQGLRLNPSGNRSD